MRVCPNCQSRYLGDDPFCSKDGQATIEADPNIRFDPLIGSSVGNYKITELLGEGGMGAVYKAEHPSIGRTVAIKVLRGEYAYRQDTIERFFNEARSVNQIRHENIVDIIDFGLLSDQRPYFVMEYLEGRDLDVYLRKRGATSLTESLDIMMPVLSALQAAHDEGIIHRDLKPENIFLYERKHGGRVVKLLDFGIAKLLDAKEQFHKTNTGSIIGTPAYMSPEQAAGRKDIDHRADVYAAGIILYELLVGEPPFDGDTALEIVHKQWKAKPPPPRAKRPDLPEEFEQIIYAALEKDRDKRIQSALQFALRLKAAISKVNISHARPSNKAMTTPEVKLTSSPGVAGLRTAFQPKKEPTPQPPKKEPTPLPPKARILSGGYPILKAPSAPGVAGSKPNSPTPDKLSRPQSFHTPSWSTLKSVPAKLPQPVKELSSQGLQKVSLPFKKPSAYDKNEQLTKVGSFSSVPPDFLDNVDRNEETQMVSDLVGGSIDELRAEATHMASAISGGSLDLLREPPQEKKSEVGLIPAESTQLGSVISGGSAEALQQKEVLQSEPTLMASALSGGSLDNLRKEDHQESPLEASDESQYQDASTVAGESSMSEALVTALRSVEHTIDPGGFFETMDGPELLGEESTQNNASIPIRDLEEEEPAPPISEYEEPSMMKEFPRQEDISSAHTSILDYDNISETFPSHSPLSSTPPVVSAMPSTERPPRREIPDLSVEVAPATNVSPKRVVPLILVFVVLAVLSGVVAVLIRQLSSTPAQVLAPAPITLPQSQKAAPKPTSVLPVEVKSPKKSEPPTVNKAKKPANP
jgi:serine/threonine protein kinase